MDLGKRRVLKAVHELIKIVHTNKTEDIEMISLYCCSIPIKSNLLTIAQNTPLVNKKKT